MSLSRNLRAGAVAVAVIALAVPGARAESLRQAMTAAYAHNPTITSALFAVKVASENIALRRSAVLPTVGASTSLSDSFALVPGGIGHQPSATVGLGYSQTLYDNHKTDANVEQARALVQVANQQLRTTEGNVLLSVVQAYMNVILNTQLVQLRSDTVQFYQSQVNAAQARQNIGEGTKIDVAQAQAALANAVAQQKAAIAALQTAQASYVHWVGHRPANLSSDYPFGTLIPPSVDRALALAGALNPTILGAKAGIRAAKAGSDAALASFGPTVGVTGALGPSFSANCLPGSACTSSPPTIGGQVKLSLSVPIYAGGALGAAARQANLTEIRSNLDTQAAIDQVDEAVVTAWASLQNAAAQIESARSAVEAGQLALNGVVQERDVGQKTTLDVLNAEATLTTAREALIGANASKVIAAFSLIAQMGKMSPHELRLNTPTKSADRYTQEVEDTWEEIPSFSPMPRPAWRP